MGEAPPAPRGFPALPSGPALPTRLPAQPPGLTCSRGGCSPAAAGSPPAGVVREQNKSVLATARKSRPSPDVDATFTSHWCGKVPFHGEGPFPTEGVARKGRGLPPGEAGLNA